MKDFITLFLLCLAAGLQAQGTFANLDFEAATVPYSTNFDGLVAAAAAFPDWTVWETNSVRDQVGYNVYLVPGGQVEIYASGFDPHYALGGLFMAHFHGWTNADAGLSQVGTVPEGARTLRFETSGTWRSDQLVVALGGQPLAWTVVGSRGPDFRTIEADVSRFAGLNEELRFTFHAVYDGGAWLRGDLRVDDIQFIPEPGTWALLCLGAAGLFLLPRRKAGRLSANAKRGER